jgi:hypothetical protein
MHSAVCAAAPSGGLLSGSALMHVYVYSGRVLARALCGCRQTVHAATHAASHQNYHRSRGGIMHDIESVEDSCRWTASSICASCKAEPWHLIGIDTQDLHACMHAWMHARCERCGCWSNTIAVLYCQAGWLSCCCRCWPSAVRSWLNGATSR